MNHIAIVFFVAACVGLSTCSPARISEGLCPLDVPTEINFKVDKYLGTWYEQQRYEQIFQLDGDCVTAQYSLNANGSVNVLNTMILLNDAGNTIVTAQGIALISFPENPMMEAKLNVSFDGNPDHSNYWVLGTDYENFSVVWGCTLLNATHKNEGAWVLSRTPILDELYNEEVDNFIDNFLARDNLRTTIQDKDQCLGDIEPFVGKPYSNGISTRK